MQSATCTAKALGHPRVWIGSRRITSKEWGARRASELFFLLLNHPEGLTKDRIVGGLFPECDETSADGLFHSTLYRCRQAIGKDTILWEDEIYRIADLSSWDYDVAEFEALVKLAKEAAKDSEAQELYERAAQLYEGDYLEGWLSEWCEGTRLRLKQLYTRSVLATAQSYAMRGLHERALELYKVAILKDYYLEAAHKGMVDSLVALGDRLAALRHYLDLVESLKRDVPPQERSAIPDLVEEILGTSLAQLISGSTVAGRGELRSYGRSKTAQSGQLVG